MANKMKVWPGPRVLVPMATDVLLIGERDIPINNGGIPMSSTKTNYFNLFFTGNAESEPFNKLSVNSQNEFKVGAHMMWTLPYSLRQGSQVKDDNGSTTTDFPFTPNRWLITRFEYSNIKNGTAPKVISKIIASDTLSPSSFPPKFSESLYPKKIEGSQTPVSQIGAHMDLSNWDGSPGTEQNTAQIKAVGPGVVSWSVVYDNIQNVYSFVDDSLSPEATSANPYNYTYSIMGWYQDPNQDLVQKIKGENALEFATNLKNNLGWDFGTDEDNSIETAIEAWNIWKETHGLNGDFNPDNLKLPPQVKAAIVAWHSYWEANGEATDPGNLAKQMLCHSMVGTVKWIGPKTAYESGNPLASKLEVPKITVGSTAIDAVSTYIAKQIQENSENGNSLADVPVISRALSAFQKDLLEDYTVDPIRVENLLHASSFSRNSAGIQWIVTRLTSDTNNQDTKPPTTFAGRQSIPLNQEQTAALTQLNGNQKSLNAINLHLETQRAELFRLLYKQNLIEGIVNTVKVSDSTKAAVLESIQALTTVIKTNHDKAGQLAQTITQEKTALQKLLVDESMIPEVDLPGYELKEVDLTGYSAPIDPIIAIAGAQLDTKFSSAVATNSNAPLAVRYTGQEISSFLVPAFLNKPSVTITAAELLSKIQMPDWNIIPKEVMGLWIENVLLDYSMAAVMAIIFFEKNQVPDSVYNAKSGTDRTTPLEDLTQRIGYRQTLVWENADSLEHTTQALVSTAGFKGILPAKAGVAFRTKQPWTPVFMDWKVRWYPTSINAVNPFDGWSLGEIDYVTSNTSLEKDGSILLWGRTILNPNVAKSIQNRLKPLEDQSLDEFPDWMQTGLEWASRQAGSFDLLTQSLSGFNEQLITKLSAATSFMSSGAGHSKEQDLLFPAMKVLATEYESYIPQVGTTSCSDIPENEQQYAPIRSGHLEIINLNVVDAFGQVMFGKLDRDGGDDSPIVNVLWSETFYSSLDKQINSFGNINPRVLQNTKVNIDLLKADTTQIEYTNSSDLTSPICGWVMANHLDNSLMVYTSEGTNIGAVIKVQSEDVESKGNWSIRWDSAPGLDNPLGAPPDIENEFLSGFINALLQTGFEGSLAFENLMQAIDSTLWTMGTYGRQQTDNLSLLVGRPIAVVRGEVSVTIAGNPIYKQYWCNTGDFYNENGTYKPQDPPYMSISFPLRIGDAFLANNGILGYFPNNKYDVFYPVYGAEGQTQNLMELLRAGKDFRFNPEMVITGFKSDYIKEKPVQITTQLNGTPTPLTMLVDPNGVIPVFSGCLPCVETNLPNGPVSKALERLTASFRVGPILLPPENVQMPTPDGVTGKWSMKQRKDTVSWSPDQEVQDRVHLGDLHSNPLRIKEGWLTLSRKDKNQES